MGWDAGAGEGGRTRETGPWSLGWSPGRKGRWVRQTHHIDELGDGQPKAHDDHIRGVGHRPCPAVVAPKEMFEEPVLRLDLAGLLRLRCGTGEERGVSGVHGGGRSAPPPSNQRPSTSLSRRFLICKVVTLSRTCLATPLRIKYDNVY